MPQIYGRKISKSDHSEPLTNHQNHGIGYYPIELPGLPSPSKNRSILDQVIQGGVPTSDSISSLFHLPQQGINSMIPMPGLTQSSTPQEALYPLQNERSDLTTRVEESIRIFGDMRTTNPFVINPPPSAFSDPNNKPITKKQLDDVQNASMISNFVADGNYATDDTKWLNSNLLNSLWMNESNETNNPWAGQRITE